MLIVISPAKSLDLNSPLPPLKTTQPQFLGQAQVLVEQLRELAPHELSRLMRISDKLGGLNYDRFQAWRRPFKPDNARPALLTFDGDVYHGLNARAFSAEDFVFAQEHLRILSGLYGVLRPLDLIQAYRLEMGTRLANPAGKDLYAFWQDTVTPALNRQIKKTGARALVNLASVEYFSAVDRQTLAVPVIEPVFKDCKNGQFKIINFFAKKARGLMSAWIIRERLQDAEALKAFNGGGYAFNAELSQGQKWVFTRKEA